MLQASASHLDLSRAPYVLYGVKFIDPVSLAVVAKQTYVAAYTEEDEEDMTLHAALLYILLFAPRCSHFLPHFRLYEVVLLRTCVLP